MSTVRLQPEVRLAEQSHEEIAAGLLEMVFEERGLNELRDRLTDIAAVLSPHELAAVYEIARSMTTDEGGAHLPRLAPMWMQLRKGGGKVFSREVLFDGSLLFRSAVQGPQRASLICFTGRLNGMFMANCKFLDLLGDHPIDIVMNSTESGTFGQWNLDGAGSFYGSLMKLKGALRALGIPTVAYTGTSAGGGPAVYAAASDPGTSAILFGGRFYLPGRIIPLAQAGTAFEPFCEGWRGAAPKIHNIYGALQPTDCKNDEHLHALVPSARSYPLANDRSHNPMVTLSMRKHLRPVMDLLAQAAHGIDVNFDLVTQA